MPRHAPAAPVVAVFGATGFLGSRLVEALLEEGAQVRAIARRPPPPGALGARAEGVRADIRDPRDLPGALEGADAAVNAVSLYRQTWSASFRDVHVVGAHHLASAAFGAGARLVHVSGLGADAQAEQRYLRARGKGERAVRAAHPGARVARLAPLVGPGDALLSRVLGLVRRLPVVPLFGRGRARMQPVHARDAARGLARLALAPQAGPRHDIAGPAALSWRELVEAASAAEGRRPALLPVPFAVWRPLAAVAERLPGAPLTQDQVALIRLEALPDPAVPGLADLGVAPRGVEAALAEATERGAG